MTNRDTKNWKLLAEIGVVVLLVAYYLYSRDMNAAVAVTFGLLFYAVRWLLK